jgi:TRAP transporter TAXI family solute receptor
MFRTCFFLLFLLAISSSASIAADFGNRDEAVAMVKRAQEMFQRSGAERTFKAITSKAKEFHDRDLYPFVYNLEGVNVAHGARPDLVGKDLIDFKDQNGKFLIREMVEVARNPGSGWVDYRWSNPITKKIEDKSAYVGKMGDYFVGVGVYRTDQINDNTIAIISGGSGSTYLQIACDLAAVLNDGDNLRILPIVGIGGPQNIRDVLKLKGIDIGLVQTSILNSFRSSDEALGINENKIVYIAKLFNEEVHLITRSEFRSLEDLQGKKVNLAEKGSDASYVLRDVFKRFGIKVDEVNVTQADAVGMLKSGEIAATALVAGKPSQLVKDLKFDAGMRFLPIPYSKEVSSDYLPAKLTAEDYPNFISPGQSVPTIADGVALIAYNWPKSNDRYRRVQKFVEALFPRIGVFQNAPRHVKWREVNLASSLPGWPRFEPAAAWLGAGQEKAESDLRSHFAQFLETHASSRSQTGYSKEEQERLFKHFLQWSRSQEAPGATGR